MTGMKVAYPIFTCQAHVTFPLCFSRYFRWKSSQTGTFPSDKTFRRKYSDRARRIRTSNYLAFSFFVFLDGHAKSSATGKNTVLIKISWIIVFCFVLVDAKFPWRHSEAVLRTSLLTVSKLRAGSGQETNVCFFSGQRESQRCGNLCVHEI